MVQTFLDKTDRNIVLIPHVMRNLDLKVLRELYEKFKDNERVFIIDNESLTAPQLKYIISQFEFYIGARTHSTIAAYSSCVPTFVIGYSVKSIGIAKDLFSSTEEYVIPVGKLLDENILSEMAFSLYEKRKEIKAHLEKIMPAYLENTWAVGQYFEKVLKG